MSLTTNLVIALGLLFGVLVTSQLIYLAMRMHHSMQLNRQRRLRDRQGNVYAVSEERPHNRYGDIFYIEPSSEDAARIREQLEKDDKELPSYDEVLRMCNLTTPTAAAAGPIGNPNATTIVAALPAPPYSEVDPISSPPATPLPTSSIEPPLATVVSMEPSTSRAAQTATSTSVTVTLSSTVSNTEV